MTDYPTCKQRIDAEWEQERHALLVAVEQEEPTEQDELEDGESPLDWWMSRLLCIDKAAPGDEFNDHGCKCTAWYYDTVYHFQLSWGGPGDGIVVYVEDWKANWGTVPHVVAAYYYFQDWFDGATLKITGAVELAALGAIVEWAL